jgi:hypothetical protein
VTSVRRRFTVAAAASAVVFSAGGASLAGASPAAPATVHHIKGGKTSIALNGDSLKALLKDNFGLTPTGKAKVRSFVLTFPVTGGTFRSSTRGRIRHTGGIKIFKNNRPSRSVTIKDLILNLHSGAGTAVVSGHGRMAAVRISNPQGGSSHSVTGYTVKLSRPLFRVLDKKFRTKAFKKHKTLGTGSTKLKFR